jgi:retinoblastoma-like protein 1
MACAFFTSVWQATSPVGHQKHELIWHYSLSKLLELCQVSVLEFFDKLNKWAEMIMATRRLLDYINRVQSNLAVSVVILKKFLPIFRHAFGQVLTQQTRQSPQKARHQNTLSRLNSASLFEFTWLFYIAMRSLQEKNYLTKL